MESEQSFEGREVIIDRLIEDLAGEEGMNPDDICSDIKTFFEISGNDETAQTYFEVLAEKIGISFEEMMEYAAKKSK